VKQRLHDLLTMQAERRPDVVAAVFQDVPTSYAALEQMSNRLARALQAAGCIKGDRVALLLTKSTRALVAIFGSLKADCIYVPLDTTSPSPVSTAFCKSVNAGASSPSKLRRLCSTSLSKLGP
jgi:long-chain acyl-CoA synthetase